MASLAVFPPTTPWPFLLFPVLLCGSFYIQTGASDKRVLKRGNIENYASAQFFPDGKRVLVCGNEPKRATRCYVQSIDGGTPQPLTPEGTSFGLISPDATKLLVQDASGKFVLYSASGQLLQEVHGLATGDLVIAWSADGRSTLAFHISKIQTSVGCRMHQVD
jgi:hypothetical protein